MTVFRPRGFSLVELLVTLAVLATLVGVLAPALSSARSQARKLQCAAQLRSIGQAFSGFARDDDSLPLAAKVTSIAHGTLQLPEQLSAYLGDAPYVTATRVLAPWACPADLERPAIGVGSYAYDATWFMNGPDLAWDVYLVPTAPQVGRMALLAYEAGGSTVELMHDAYRYHRAQNSPGAGAVPRASDWQALYFDGSVRSWR